ncbi:hypothetical protein LWI28_020769 [Acer negundo]|uniref:Disease resistance N-terminal domain-containing protein n=1 Tax=Acer negundo TaxID=4023 RepID=A0AAD5INE5_ACENE|nr:hypothetical protein LWI28_020769 [Acer negundo]
MAELVVSALLGAIFSSLTSSPFRSLKLDGKWLNDLKSYLLRIDAILDDVDLKDHGNRELKLWFDKLKEVRYEIEDMLNEIVTEGFRREWEAKSRNIKSRVRGIVSIKSSFEKDIQHRWKSITKKIEYLQMHREKFGLEYAPMIARKPDQLSVAKEGPEDESQAWRSVKKDTERKRFQRPTSSLVTIPEVIEEGENFPCLKQIRISGCLKLAKCLPLHLSSAKVEISECPLLRVPVTDGNKMQLENEYDIVSSELMTDVSSQTHSSCPELSMLSTELAIPKLPVTVDKQVHEGNSRKENILDRSSTSRLSKVEELQLPDTNVVRSTDVSITSNRPPPEAPTHLTEDSSAKHGGALDTSLAATEISADTVTDDPINDEGDKAQFRRNEKVLDRPSTSRLQEIEELQLPVSDVVQRTDVLATSNSPPPESSERLTEDSSVKHEGASDNSSAATMILSDTNTDDPINDEGDKAQLRRNENLLDRPSTSRLQEIEELQLPDVNVPQITDVSITSNMPPPESPTRLTEDSTAKHEGASDNSSAPTEISSDTDDPINDEGDKAQFRRNEKLLDRPSTSRLQELEELQLPDSNVARRTAVLATSNSPPSESSKRLTEDSSIKYRGASDNSSAATEISSDSDTDNPINIWYDEESLEDISSPEQESLNVSEISQLKRLPPKLYSLKIEACKALKSLPEELMHSNLQHLYIINCQFLKSVQASHLPVPLKTLYIRKCHSFNVNLISQNLLTLLKDMQLCLETCCRLAALVICGL